MSNDAKLGLVLGVALVLVIGLVFFRSDSLEARLPTEYSRATTPIGKDEPARSTPQADSSSTQP